MKRTFNVWLSFIVLSLLGSFSGAFAQETPQPLPIDKDVRMGKLDNGLTYFIRHNEQPKQRANFYIVQRVGSMQEEDNQAGLAHFLEHMAFNGAKNFEGKEMINYLESIGVKFGAELNAYTSFDETRYTIKDAPVARTGVIDSCILILRDWSDGIALLDEEIDNERGVIQEEWRQGENGNMRMMKKLLETSYAGLRYGNRLPIGSMDVIRNFTYQELRDYYHKWYRPDLQGLVIVGDVDVAYVEEQIKKTFADMPAPVNPAERVYEAVPDREAPLAMVLTDPEGTMTMVSMSYSFETLPQEYKASALGLSLDYMWFVESSMMNARLNEIAQKPDAPFVAAQMSIGPALGLVMTKDNIDFTAIAHEGRADEALKCIATELKRAKEYGFTAAEYQRASLELVNSLEDQLNSKDNCSNSEYADEYSDYFTKGGYIPGIEVEYQLMSQLAQGVNIDVINQHFQSITEPNNLLIYVLGKQGDGIHYPTEEELLTIYNDAMKAEVEPYTDEFSGIELMEQLPEPGKLLSEERDQMFGAMTWTFDNGAKVYLLPTDYKKNDIQLRAISHGGYLQLVDGVDELGSINVRAMELGLADVGGLADYDETALTKILAGKIASLSTSVDETVERIKGSSSEKDFETMLQLLYLNMTSMRKDANAFLANAQKQKAIIKASQADPMTTFFNNIPALLYPDDEVRAKLTEEDIDKVEYDKIYEAYKARFANASDFTFYIVGSFEPETIYPLVERYIGGLPGNHQQEADQKSLVKGVAKEGNEVKIDLDTDTPMAVVLDYYARNGKYGLKENMVFDILGEVLSQQFFKSIREDEGGTYGVAVQTNVFEAPRGEEALLVFFQTNPDQVAKLNGKVKSELRDIVDGKINIDTYFDKTVLNMQKAYEQNIRENKYWLNTLVDYYFKGENFHDNYLETLKSITKDDVRAALNTLLAESRYFEQIGVSKVSE